MNEIRKISTQVESASDTQAKKLHILSDIAARQAKKRKRNKRNITLIAVVLLGLAALAFGVIFLFAERRHTVSFYINSELLRTVEIEDGEYLTKGDVPIVRGSIGGTDFVGWFTNPAGEGEPFDYETTPIKNNLSLHAVYKPKTVTLQVFLNDGTENAYPLTGNYQSLVDILNQNFINQYLSTEYQLNYQLIGFDRTNTTTNPQYSVNDKVSLYEGSIYAIWKGVDVQVQLTGAGARHFNEAAFETQVLNFSYGENYVVNIDSFQDVYEQGTGARVIGIMVDSDGSQTLYTPGQQVKIKSGMHFRLAFEANKNNILTLVYNNGTAPQTFYGYNRRVVLPNNITYEHFILNGYDGPLGRVPAGEVTIKGEVTYSAIWSGVFYLITLNSENAQHTGTTQLFQKYSEGYYLEETSADKLDRITIPQKTGHNFLGYYTEKDGEGDQIINEEGEIIEQNFTRFSENTMLYAHYEAIILTVEIRGSSVGEITAPLHESIPDEETKFNVIYGSFLNVSVQLYEKFTHGYAHILQVFRTEQHPYVNMLTIGSATEPATFIFQNITEDLIITVPVFAENEYTIKWVNWDGSVLTQETYRHGEVPNLSGLPFRPGSPDIRYEFSGWDPVVVEATDHATYTATYRSLVTKPLSINDLIYNGSSQSVNLDAMFYTVTSQQYTDAGDYLATVSLKDATHEWTDGSTDEFTLPWRILPMQVSKPLSSSGNSFVYTGEVYDFEARLSYLNKDIMDISGTTSATAVGSYFVTVSLKDNNYNWQTWDTSPTEPLNFNWQITKADLIVKAYDIDMLYIGTPLVLDGNPATTTALFFQGFRFGDSKEKDIQGEFSITTSPAVALEAGEYDIILSEGSATSQNYNLILESGAKLTIRDNRIIRPRLEISQFIYTSGVIAPVIANYNEEDMEILEGSVCSATDANLDGEEYVIMIAPKDNHVWGVGGGREPEVLTWKINKAVLKVRANHQSVVYGSTPTFTVNYNLLGSDATKDPYPISGDFEFGGPAITATDIGSYEIAVSAGTASAANYTFEFESGILTIVEQKIPVPSMGHNTFVYASAMIDAPIIGYDVNTMDLKSGSYLSASDVGTYFITLSPKNNYEWITGGKAEREFTWHITKAMLTVKANDITITYGDDIPELTYDILGWLGEDETVGGIVNGEFALTTDALEDSPAGSYDILISLGEGDNAVTSHNYDFNLENGSITILQRNQAIPTLVQNEFDYNAKNVDMMSNILNFNADAMNIEGDLEAVDAGVYQIYISLKESYQWMGGGTATVILPWQINKQDLTVKINDKTITYGDAIPTLDITYSGFIAPDNAASAITGNFIAMTTAHSNSDVGDYQILFSNTGTAKNYNITQETGTLTIIAQKIARPTLLVNSFIYDATEITPEINNFIDNDSVMVIDEDSVLSETNANNDGENYTITIMIASTNYEWATAGSVHQQLNWTINKAELIIKANDVSIYYGEPIDVNDPKDISYIGFKGDDNELSGAISVSFMLQSDGMEGSPVGDYEIRFINISFASVNYNVTWQQGNLYILENDNIIKPYLVITSFPYTATPITPAIFGFDPNTMEIDTANSTTTAVTANGINPDYRIIIRLKSGNRWQDEPVGQDPTDVTLRWKITKVNLQVYVNNKSFVWDDPFPTFSGVPTSTDLSYEGFKPGDNAANSIMGSFQVQAEAGVVSTSPIGNYDILLAMGTASSLNYNLILENGTDKLTILAKRVTEPTLEISTFVYNALLREPVILNFDDTAMMKSGDLSATNVNNYQITFALLPNHEWERGGTANIIRNWSVTKAPLTVKANDITIIYGEAIPSFSGNPQTSPNISYYGFLESDDKSVIKGSFGLSTTATDSSDAGAYNIALNVTSASADNYELYPINGTLTIAERVVAKPYLPNSNYDYTAGDITPTITNFNSEFMEAEIGTDTTARNAGNYTITIDLKPNYTWDGSRKVVLYWQINKVSLYVRANNKTMIFGSTPPTLSGHPTSPDISFSGFKGADNNASGAVTGVFTLTCSVTSSTPAGTYPIAISRGTTNAQNYNIITEGGRGDFTVLLNTTDLQPSLSETVFEYTAGPISPYVNNFDPNTMTMTGTTLAVGASTYTITISLKAGYTWSDGTSNPIQLHWEITKAMLTIKADDQSRPYNTENQPATYSITGLIGSDTETSQIDGLFKVTHTAVTTSPIGLYQITIESLAVSNNYEFTLIDGLLEVYKQTLSKPTAPVTSFIYRGVDIPLNLSGFSAQSMNVTGNVQKDVGNYIATISLIDDANYIWADDTSGSFDILWSIEKTLLIITAKDRTKIYLDPIPAFNGNPKTSTDLTYAGFEGSDNETNSIDGAFSITTSCLQSSIVGTYDIILGIGTATAKNYTLQLTNGNYYVSPIQLVKPTTLGATTFTFDNIEKTLNFSHFDSLTMNISGNKRTDAGSYTATISLKDTHNYQWADTTITPLNYNWTINKLMLVKPTITSPPLTFNEQAQSPSIEPNYFYTIEGNTAVTAGNYTATVTLNFNDENENVVWFDLTTDVLQLPWEILQYKPTLNPQVGTYEYILGQLLNSKTINETAKGVSTNIPGAFTFVNPTHKPLLSTTSVQIRFTPADTTNYSTETYNLQISVRQVGVYFYSNGGSAVSPIYGEYGDNINPPTQPTRTGYTFDAWYYDNGTFSSSVTWPIQLLENINVYAKWDIIVLTVSFSTSSSNGTAAVDFPNNIEIEAGQFASQQINYGSSYTINLNAMPFTKSGYRLFQISTGRAVIGVQIGGVGTVYTSSIVVTSNITLTFAFASEADAVTINYNGGSGNGLPPAQPNATFLGAGSNLTVADVKKEYYFLLGYYHQNINWAVAGSYALLSRAQLQAKTVESGGITYYAIWEPITVKFTYNVNSGTGAAAGGASAKYGTANFALATRGTLTRVDYTFNGWAKTAGGSLSHAPGAPINVNDTFLKDSSYTKTAYTIGQTEVTVTLYARWTRNQTTIHFNYGAGSGTPLSITVLSGENITNISTDSRFQPSSINYFGYYHSGWSTTQGGATLSGAWKVPSVSETTLYAKWTAYQSTITFDKRSGTGGSSGTTATYGLAMPTASMTGPTRTGYLFQGYYDATSGGTRYYTQNMASARTWNKTNATITLYAQWTAKIAEVFFDMRGGSAGTGSVKATYDAPMPPATAPTRTGYSFNGYFDATSGGTKYYNANMTSARNWNVNTTGSVILYAQWTARSYSITRNSQGGNLSGAVTVHYDSHYNLGVPTRTGYTFDGWFTASSSGTRLTNTSGASVSVWKGTSSITGYAQWTPLKTNITFDKRGGTGGSGGTTATYGLAMPTASMSAPSRTGYTFDGYFDATSGGVKYYNANMTSARTWNKTNSTYTLYAQWTAIKTTITFNKRSGSGGSNGTTATYGLAMQSGLTRPSRSGYTFLGYFDATSGGVKYYNANMTSARTWNKTTSTATLYAQWRIDEIYCDYCGYYHDPPECDPPYCSDCGSYGHYSCCGHGYSNPNWCSQCNPPSCPACGSTSHTSRKFITNCICGAALYCDTDGCSNPYCPYV